MKKILANIESGFSEDIRNCEFKFKCPKQWDDLKSNPHNANIKHCDTCEKLVYLVETEEELVYKVWQNLCVAIPQKLGEKIFTKEMIKSAHRPLVGQVRIKR